MTCKPQKILPARMHWSTTILSRKMAVHEGAFMSLFTKQSGGQRVVPSQDSAKTHSNNLVVLAHIQFLPFYCFSTRDVTHVRKCTRPSPALPYCKRREAGRGPGDEATTFLYLHVYVYRGHTVGPVLIMEFCVLHFLGQLHI